MVSHPNDQMGHQVINGLVVENHVFHNGRSTQLVVAFLRFHLAYLDVRIVGVRHHSQPFIRAWHWSEGKVRLTREYQHSIAVGFVYYF